MAMGTKIITIQYIKINCVEEHSMVNDTADKSE